MSDTAKCPTYLLDDLPASEDSFGPHNRIAGAVVSLITSEHGGRAVGIEGGWGSGKSTVVNFIRNSLKADRSYRVISFDAWAHEGDPLRRTYLEGIIRELIEAGWIESAKWNKTLEELANRLKSTTIRTTPKPTWLGGIFAVSLVLVPIGTTLVTSAFRQNGEAQVSDILSWPWIAYLGAVIALAPLWVLFCNAIRVALRDSWRWIRSFTRWPAKRSEPTSDWSFLLSKAIEETRTDTTETPNPTSIEFEAHFTSAMKEALGSDPNRRLVLVLDNLDRVDTNSAISVWSTLQTFLQERTSQSSQWFKQLWVVVPYDPAGLRKLWDNWRNVSSDEEDDDTSVASASKQRQRIASDSFIDKSFQIRFQVPPPVLSDWKAYLGKLVEKALPSHDEADRHAIYRVYEEWRNAHAMPPTPRELKLYVNQIGAIHRQWQHEFPIEHVAYYVLFSRHGDSLIEQLKDKAFPPANIRRLFKEDIIPSLAGLAFNVPANKGMEILLSDPIYNCLASGTASELAELCELHKEGFWTVAEGVVATRLRDASASSVAHAHDVFFQSNVLDGNVRLESQEIRRGLREAVDAVTDWQPLDQAMAEGISAMHRLFKDRDFSTRLMKTIADSVSRSKASDKKADVSEVPRSLITVLQTLTDLGLEESIPQSFSVPGDAEAWIGTCEALCDRDGAEPYLTRFKPKEKADAIAAALQTAAGAGEFGERHLSAVQITSKSVPKTDWSTVISAIQTRLDAGTGAGADEMRPLLKALWVLRNGGDAKAAKSLKTLVTSGHIAHHLHQSAKHKEGSALCQFTILHEDPTASTPPAVGNSASGQQLLVNSLASSDESIAKPLLDTFTDLSTVQKLLELIDARGACDPLLAACLRGVATGPSPQRLFTADTVLSRWESLQEALDAGEDKELFDKLVVILAQEHGLCDAIRSGEDGFNTAAAELYWRIIRSATADLSEFFEWCKQGVEALDKDEWLSDLNGTQECVWLACLLLDKNVPVKLTTPFADALVDHASSVVKGENIPESEVVKRWHDVLSLLEESTRKALLPRLLVISLDSDGAVSKDFFTMYGDDIADREVLSSNSRAVEGLFSPIVRQRNISGLEWMVKAFNGNSEFLDSLRSQSNTGEFRTRLQDCVNDAEDDEAQPLIAQIADALGIQAAVDDADAEAGQAE